jgi:hypothetical protein
VESIATCYGLDGLCFEPRWEEISLTPLDRHLDSTQPAIQWVPRLFSGGEASGK